MNHLLSITMLLLILTPRNQNLPKEFYQIPEQFREQATVVFTGTFHQDRTPCVFRPDGTRVWYIDSWFAVSNVYRGEVGHKSIRLNTAMLPDSPYISRKLQREQNYLVLLRPDEETARALKTEQGLSFLDSLHDEEIIAIVKLR